MCNYVNTDLSKHLKPGLQSWLLVWLHLKCRKEKIHTEKVNLVFVHITIRISAVHFYQSFNICISVCIFTCSC